MQNAQRRTQNRELARTKTQNLELKSQNSQLTKMNLFNIRVYGILINEKKQVLVSDEFIRGSYYTKFPGGGLEFGEGTRDCLQREFMEEMNLKVEVGEH